MKNYLIILFFSSLFYLGLMAGASYLISLFFDIKLTTILYIGFGLYFASKFIEIAFPLAFSILGKMKSK